MVGGHKPVPSNFYTQNTPLVRETNGQFSKMWWSLSNSLKSTNLPPPKITTVLLLIVAESCDLNCLVKIFLLCSCNVVSTKFRVVNKGFMWLTNRKWSMILVSEVKDFWFWNKNQFLKPTVHLNSTVLSLHCDTPSSSRSCWCSEPYVIKQCSKFWMYNTVFTNHLIFNKGKNAWTFNSWRVGEINRSCRITRGKKSNIERMPQKSVCHQPLGAMQS